MQTTRAPDRAHRRAAELGHACAARARARAGPSRPFWTSGIRRGTASSTSAARRRTRLKSACDTDTTRTPRTMLRIHHPLSTCKMCGRVSCLFHEYKQEMLWRSTRKFAAFRPASQSHLHTSNGHSPARTSPGHIPVDALLLQTRALFAARPPSRAQSACRARQCPYARPTG